jgi:hypothetical protein
MWHWVTGKVIPPLEVLDALATTLEDRALEMREAAAALRAQADARRAQPKRLRGFFCKPEC